MSALAQAHILGQQRLRALVSTAVGTAWRSLPAYDEADIDPFLARTVPLVLAGQRQSVALTEAYLARSLGRAPLGLDPDTIIGPAIRSGATPEEVYRRPFVTVWTALKAGTQFQDAVEAGFARATSTAEMDIQLAARGTFAAAQRADDTIRGYRRVADGGACEFCVAIDGAFVKTADAMPLHNRCGCGLDPIVDEAVHATPAPESVAVHEHGELGPVLTDPSHAFTPEGAL